MPNILRIDLLLHVALDGGYESKCIYLRVFIFE